MMRDKLKRVTAFLLAAVMGLAVVSPAGAVTSYAATELENQNLGNGKITSTAFGWRSGKGAGEPGNSTYRFDMKGINATGQDYNNAGIMTTYNHQGYATWLSPENGGNPSYNISGAMKHNALTNGGVMNIDNNELGKLEFKIAVSPSSNDDYIFVDYYIFSENTVPKTLYLGTGADTKIGDDDRADCMKTDRGFFMVNDYPKNYGSGYAPGAYDESVYRSTFECITKDENLGIEGTSTKWVGYFTGYWENLYKESAVDIFGGSDSGIAYSWKFQINPYEIVHKRVAFAIRPTSYFVSATGTDAPTKGSYSEPFETIEYAVSRLSGKMGYIYIMDEFYNVSNTIDLGSNSSTNITIMSAGYDSLGRTDTQHKTIVRDSSLTGGPLFKTSGATVKFGDISLDGNKGDTITNAVGNNSPILEATAGTIGIQNGAVLKNNKVTGNNIGSAIDLQLSGNLEMNNGTITDNESNGRGAVNYSSNNGHFSVKNKVNIFDNKNGTINENIFLANGNTLTIAEKEGLLGNIGVTTQTPPTVDPSTGSPSAPVIVANKTNLNSVAAPAEYQDFITPDLQGAGIYVNGNDDNVVFEANGLELTLIYEDMFGDPIGSGQESSFYAPGQSINVPGVNIPNYDYMNYSIEPSSQTTLAVAADGTVSGKMPISSVTVRYKYKAQGSVLSFKPNYGTPAPASITGIPGNPTGATLPNITKYGYIFDGWYYDATPMGGTVNTKALNLPAVFPTTDIEYTAVWNPDPSMTSNLITRYQNENGSILFYESVPSAHVAEDPIQALNQNIPGYTVMPTKLTTIPEKYEDVFVGYFDPSSTPNRYNFAGTMPNQDTDIQFVYEVDSSVKFPVTIQYVDGLGQQISPSDTADLCSAETMFTASPKSIYGFTLDNFRVVSGENADPSQFLSGLVGGFNASGIYTGRMPNQPVVIEYIYTSSGIGFDYSVRHLDLGSTPLRGDIIPPSVRAVEPGIAVEAERKSFYGYTSAGKTVDPSGYGSFDTVEKYTGSMPNSDKTVSYEYNRDSSKWVTVTYKKAGAGLGSLIGAGQSGELMTNPSGDYYTSVLKNDGSADAMQAAYTWDFIQQRRMLPGIQADPYYRFAGWYVDVNNNGIVDAGDILLTSGYQFTGNTTVLALFEEDPDLWVDIYFENGENGSISSTPASLHKTIDTVWSSIETQLPVGTPVPNYLLGDWYLGSTKVLGTDLLQNGRTYTLHFEQDPDEFGTVVQTPEAKGSVDVDGSGKITVYDTTEGYKYIIVDSDGNVVAVKEGSSVNDRLVFPDLYPGSRYNVYEAPGDTVVSVGDQESSLTGVGTPKNVLIPVVENNVLITYDEQNEGKTKIVIEPADPDTDYALLDKNGNEVVGWKTPDGSGPSVIFPDLDYDETYIVVAKPHNKNVTPESKVNDGTALVTDPGGMLEIPTFIVETKNGSVVQVGDDTVNSSRETGILKDTLIKLSADAVNSAGENFLYWKVIVGHVPGFTGKVTNREVTFLMPDTNVVVCAYYDRSNGNANVVDEVRGGNENEMALDPDDVEGLENTLTTPKDQQLISQNNANVTYKVVFNKNNATSAETGLIKASGLFEMDHISAFKAAWGLDVNIERYVNGRKVPATPSNATFDVIVQLDKEDVDMMDYLLVEIGPGGAVSEIYPDRDPETTGGLFKFTATAESRYVLVYSKAYHVTFLNEIKSREWPLFPNIFYHSFKVRKDEYVTYMNYYSSEYGQVETPISTLVDNDGVQHDFKEWSVKNMPENSKLFVETNPIRKKTIVYAYYDNNRSAVLQKRDELDQLIKIATDLSREYFLTQAQVEYLKGEIAIAQDIFDQVDRKATYEELQAAIDRLKLAYEKTKKKLDEQNDNYEKKKGNGGSGGGSGSGSKSDPFIPKYSNVYKVGTNGNWKLVDKGSHQWSFVLNGGIALSSMWAYLEYSYADESKTGWYHFNGNGIMNSGWFQDEKSDWYYCDTIHDGWFGKMKTGWHYDEIDKNWYYLDPVSGTIAKGWREIDGKWYCFASYNPNPAYEYDMVSGQWILKNPNTKPLGTMYKSEKTPDGYFVDENGVWIQ